MLNNIILDKILFLDIETVPQHPSYDKVPDKIKGLWDKKAVQLAYKEELAPDEMYPRAGIYAEFGKIVCITVGMVHGNNENPEFRLKSFFGDDEKILLSQFSALLNTHYHKPEYLLCAHNGKEFDFPYISRRLLINGLSLPKLLDNAGKKPWEIQHLDTLELWKFGDYKHYTSLNLLAAVFNIPTPKDDIDGSDVWKVYWKDNDLKRIVNYCQKDVLTIAQLLLRLKALPLIKPENISIS